MDALQPLLPFALLALLLVAPRRGGRPRLPGSEVLAAFVLLWGLACIGLARYWDELMLLFLAR